jgi:TonB family protein
MNSLRLANLLAYSLQILAIVAAGGLLSMLFRMRHPSAQLLYWQALLAVCLAIFVLQPRQRPAVPASTPAHAARIAVSPATAEVSAPGTVSMEGAALALLAAGAVLRALWLLLGLWRLRRYRVESEPLHPLPDSLEAARALIPVNVAVCLSEQTHGPVTFGFRNPAILLPADFLNLAPQVQQCIAVHEFLHVRRRDWLVSLVEEMVGVVLWFHPAVWWLLSQIRLAREQVVDREVVRLLEARDPYLNALLAIAGARARLDLAPAPLFLRRRHLAARVRSLLQEVSMSHKRMLASYVSITAALAVTGWFALLSFPLQGLPQADQATAYDPPGITVDPGGKLLPRRPVLYPSGALQKRIEGTVLLEVTLDAEGAVSDARVISGPEELRKAALQAVLTWRYAPDPSLPSRVQVSIDFRLPPPGALGLQSGAGVASPVIESIDVSALPEPARGRMLARLAPLQGQPLTAERMGEVRQAVADTELEAATHAGLMWKRNPETGNMSLVIAAGVPSVAPSAPPDFPPSGKQRIRVGGNVLAQKLIHMPEPEYPPLAQQARIQGLVRIAVLIGTDGRVRDMRVQSGHPLLIPAALAAVKEYAYHPTLLNGQPVDVVSLVDVNFLLPR